MYEQERLMIYAGGPRRPVRTRCSSGRRPPRSRLCAREEAVIGRYGEQPGDLAQRLRITRSGDPLYDQELAVGAAFAGWNSAAVVGDRKALGSIVVVDPETANLDLFEAATSPDLPDTAVMRLAADAMLITSLAPDTISLRHRLDTAFARFAATDVRW